MANRNTHMNLSYQRGSPTALLQPNFPNQFGESSVVTQPDRDSNYMIMQTSYNPSPYLDTSTTPSPSSLTMSTDRPNASSSPSLLLDSPDVVYGSSNQPRKARKEKRRIKLAPDQPPTTQGRPRARVFVACIQCRGRKIRCDGAKPVCHHCSQRDGDEQCTYDALPKRRGPDRVQGARTRGVGPTDDGEPTRRRRRRSTTVEQAAGGGSYSIRRACVTAKSSTLGTLGDSILFVDAQQNDIRLHTLDRNTVELLESGERFSSNTSLDQALTLGSTSNGHPPVATLAEHGNSDEATLQHPGASFSEEITAAYAALAEKRRGRWLSCITPDPSVQFSRKIWWDHLLNLYAVSIRVSNDPPPLGLTRRDVSMSQIINDIRFVFKSSHYWFSFLNVPRFYNNFMDPIRRSRMQPSLLLSLLAMSTFLQSSERAYPEESRRMAVLLRDEAQGYLEASLHARAIDEELAQAAWILAFFEVSGHPQHQMTRVRSSMNVLDSIIRSLAISYLDANNPAASTFSRNTVPIVEVSSEEYFPAPQQSLSLVSMPSSIQYVHQQQIAVDPTIQASGCPCDSLSLGFQWPEAQTQVPHWVATPMWNLDWSEGDIKKEECRRLCWSVLMLVSGHTSFAAAANWRQLDLFMFEPANYSILFPGESLLSSYPHLMGGKDTVWALYLRAMLLWNACVRMRHDTSITDLDRRDFAMRAWLETEAIEKALQWHTCSIEREFMFNGREFLFNTRMCISYEFQRFIPHVLIGLNRKKSEEWLWAQGKRARMVIFSMHAITGNNKHNLVQRPWFMWWFMGQSFRTLTLWQRDNSLTIALDVCKAFLEPIEYLANFYPGHVQRTRLDELRERLRLAILTAEATGDYVPTPVEML